MKREASLGLAAKLMYKGNHNKEDERWQERTPEWWGW